MIKTYTLKELKCPECSKILALNLEKIDYIKEVNINYDRKELTIEARRDLTENEIKLILDTIINLSHCAKHNHLKLTRKFNYAHVKYKFVEQLKITDEYTFENIDCPNCALKVERALNKLKGVINAKVNFVNKKIIITHEANVSVYESVCTEVKRIESGASVYKEKPLKKSKKIYDYVFFILGVAIFIPTTILWHLQDNMLYYILFIISYLLIGYKVLINSFKNFIHGEIFDENLLMLLASIGSFGIKEPSEAILVVLLYRIGEKFQAMAIEKSTKEIEGLMNLKVESATLTSGEEKPLKEIHVNDEILIKVGQMIPLDGIVINGNTLLDTKSLTGESMPQEVNEGMEVLSGCINLHNVITVKVTKAYEDSTISQVVKLIDEANNKKSKTEEFITKFARIYTPVVLLLALVIGGVLWFGFDLGFVASLKRVLVFLVVSCPCALVISVPLGFFGGIGKASSKGILIKGGTYLEKISKTKTIVFDKTGTLTEGNFEVDEVNCVKGLTAKRLLQVVASIEANSHHPIALSIIKANHKKLLLDQVEEVEELSGFGLKAKFMGHIYLIGNEKLMKENQILYLKKESLGTIVYVSMDEKFIGSITIIDELKPRAKETIRYLKNNHYKSIMLSGDNQKVVNDVMIKLEIDEGYSELLPLAKYEKLAEIMENKKNVVYVGDGINDTPSIVLASVGIAMGKKGSDIAKSAADVIIINDDIGKIIDLVHISQKTMHIIYQNIILSLSIKIIILVLSTFNLLGQYAMLFGVLSDVGLCMLAILNSLRIIYDRK